MNLLRLTLLVLASLLAPAAVAGAQGEARTGMLALVVGSNRSGPGQEDLHFAENDAERFADVLVEIGGYPAAGVKILRSPDRKEMLAALEEAGRRLADDRRRGVPSVFTFFYSGHARATALSLGPDELPLSELRQQLLAMPATVTVAILDACQTGAISHIKGAAPAADFSFHSVSDLNAAGTAIMASSTGSELSQESDRLGSSYFTHHLLVGLRGAADADSDGRVTLSEAYRYAYHRTLVDTASTAIGRQHVTLENDLKGKGEMVLTYPARASAHLAMSSTLAGDVVIEKRPSATVVAEVTKVSGESLTLGLPPGRYSAWVRTGRSARRCDVTLAAGASSDLVIEGCSRVAVEEATAKRDERWRAPWGLELTVGLLGSGADAFNHRIGEFGFESDSRVVTPVGSLALTRSFGRYLTVVLRFDTLESSEATRAIRTQSDPTRSQTYDWQAFGLAGFLRAGIPFVHGVVTPYLQGGAGVTLGLTRYLDASAAVDDRQTFWGYQLAASAGLEVMPWFHYGFLCEATYRTAPVVRTLVGDVHDSGGFSVNTGFRAAF